MSETFQVGDVVKLKSGGPNMTVLRIDPDENGGQLTMCIWFDVTSEAVTRAEFPSDTLQKRDR